MIADERTTPHVLTGHTDEKNTPRSITAADQNPYERLRRLFGVDALEQLAQARVLVLGIGGVGSHAAEALLRGGVGTLVVVDGDVVAAPNINRQAVAYQSTVGKSKVNVFAERAADIMPACTVVPIKRFLLPEDVGALLDEAGPLDWVVDACDTIAVKIRLAELAQERGFKLITSAGVANKLRPEFIKVGDLFGTSVDPICRVMRREARRRGIKQLTVAYSTELPVQVAHAEGATWHARTNLGTTSYMPAIMGLTIASHVILNLTGMDKTA